MSLLKRSTLNGNTKRIGLIAAASLLAIPCVAAAGFAFHLKIDSPSIQEPSREAQEKNEMRARREQEIKEKLQHEAQELAERIKVEPNAEVKAKLERRLAELKEQMDKPMTMARTSEGDRYVMLADEKREREEREQERKHQAVLTQMAKISMDQAIQIATSQTPGKVFECSLVGERWADRSEEAKPGLVLYHVVILSGDDAKPTTTHVLVNAVDGTIFRTSTEERREENMRNESESKSEEELKAQSRARLKAIRIPEPEYPDTARAAKVSGEVAVQITVDQEGNVVAAKALSGHPLLQAAAVAAAREAKFEPATKDGQPVKMVGVVTYNFHAK